MTDVKKEEKPLQEARIFEIRLGEGPGSVGNTALVPDPGTGHSKPIRVSRRELVSLAGCNGVEIRAIDASGKVIVPWKKIKDKDAIKIAVGKKGKKQ